MSDYSTNSSSKLRFIFLTLFVLAVVAAGGVYFMTRPKNQILSPLPKAPSFQIIFYTPTPVESLPTSTPSATPKVKAGPTTKPTTKPTPKPTTVITPTSKPTE
jgi:hypothetical protein